VVERWGVLKLADASINLEWRYYKDGNAWLGKATYRKKTVPFWSIQAK
jgi:hypothetical protein